MLFICHLELELEIILTKVLLKRSILAISYYRQQHRGRKREFLSLCLALLYSRKCCCLSWLYRYQVWSFVSRCKCQANQSCIDCDVSTALMLVKREGWKFTCNGRAFFTKSPVNVAKNTPGKQGERELKKHERDIYSLVALRIGWFQNTPLTQNPFLFGTRLGFVDHDSHCCTHKVKEAIHIRLHPASSWRNRNSWSMDAYDQKA